MLVLICGHSRAGKTTLSRVFENAYHVVHVDDAGYVDACRQARKHHDIVVEGLYLTPKNRKCIAATNERSICIFVDTPKEIRDARRGYDMKFEGRFVIPACSEGWDEIYAYRDGRFELLERR